jgi:hypothetical protein
MSIALNFDWQGASIAGTVVAGLAYDGGVFFRAPSAQIVYDSFHRADSTSSLGSAETGQLWQTQSSVWGITSNTARFRSSSGGYAAYFDVGIDDYTIELGVAISTSGGLIWRMQPTGQNYYLWNYGTGVQAIVSNVATTLVNSPYSGASIIRVVSNGHYHIGYKDGVQVWTLTDDRYVTGSRAGMRATAANSGFNSFSLSRNV